MDNLLKEMGYVELQPDYMLVIWLETDTIFHYLVYSTHQQIITEDRIEITDMPNKFHRAITMFSFFAEIIERYDIKVLTTIDDGKKCHLMTSLALLNEIFMDVDVVFFKSTQVEKARAILKLGNGFENNARALWALNKARIS